MMKCWETRVGQEMYKLTLFDLLINIAVLVLVEFPRRYCVYLLKMRCCQFESGLHLNIFNCVFPNVGLRMVVDNWSSKVSQLVGRQEFVVSSNVLGLVYSQTVVWTGALFCPLLPLINTVKFVILFYCKKVKFSFNRQNVSSYSFLFDNLLVSIATFLNR